MRNSEVDDGSLLRRHTRSIRRSDSILRIIPSSPTFVPATDDQQTAASLVRGAFPHADAIDVRAEETVTFVDAGSNFDAAFCPSCGSELDHDWWANSMDDAAATEFDELGVTLPCCGRSASLDGLRYEMPQGFARFVIEVVNPDVTDVPAGLTTRLRDVLKCDVRCVVARY